MGCAPRIPGRLPGPSSTLGGGLAAAILYIVIVLWLWPSPLPLRLLYDGYIPPLPYRWARPPLVLTFGNQPPEPGTGLVPLTPSGSAAASIETGDQQAAIVFPKAAIKNPGQVTAAAVRITPLDPSRLAPSPPGLRIDGNAYRIDAVYVPSHGAVELRAPVIVVLRYPTGATKLLRLTGSRWEVLSTSQVLVAFQVYGPTPALGTFAAAGPPTGQPGVSTWLYRGMTVALWVGVAVIVAFLVRDYIRQRRRHRNTA